MEDSAVLAAAGTVVGRSNNEQTDDRETKGDADSRHLQQLAEDASLEAAESFATHYAIVLPCRVGLDRAHRQCPGYGYRCASLNLQATSWLAAALRMNHPCRELELAVALANWAAATSVSQDIQQRLPRLQEALACRPSPAIGVPAKAGSSPGNCRIDKSVHFWR